jgi:hypothetical protein
MTAADLAAVIYAADRPSEALPTLGVVIVSLFLAELSFWQIVSTALKAGWTLF